MTMALTEAFNTEMEDVPKKDGGRLQASLTVSRASVKARLADWLLLTPVAFGAVLTFLWTASLLGLSVWVLVLLV